MAAPRFPLKPLSVFALGEKMPICLPKNLELREDASISYDEAIRGTILYGTRSAPWTG